MSEPIAKKKSTRVSKSTGQGADAVAEPPKTRVAISASDLAPICGMDYYNNWAKVIAKIWKQVAPDDFEDWQQRAKSSGRVIATDRPQVAIQTLSTAAAAGGRQEAAAAIQTIQSAVSALNRDTSKSSAGLVAKQAELKQAVAANQALTTSEKEQLIGLMTSATNTRHGVSNEVSGYQIFAECMGKPCTAQQKGLKYTVFTDDRFEWVLTGRLDGLTEDGEVVEIKNRTKGLFRKIRDYEAVQLQAYIHMTGAQLGHLLELHRLADGRMDYDIKTLARDPEFMTGFIPVWFTRAQNFVLGVLPSRNDLKQAIIIGDCRPNMEYYK
jgi:hypothetical protein